MPTICGMPILHKETELNQIDSYSYSKSVINQL